MDIGQRLRRREWLRAAAAVAALGARVRPVRAAGDVPLRVALSDAPSTLDPQRAFAPADRAMARLLYEPLLRYGAVAAPEPGAALSVVANEAADRWTFDLRPDLRWSDGSPLDAGDFVRGWLRLFSRDVPDDLFLLVRPVDGAGLYRAGIVAAEAVGLRAPDPATVRIDLDGPAGQFAHVAALWLAAPAQQPRPAGARAAPAGAAGNGPYRVSSWGGDRSLDLAPNEHYWAGPPAAALALIFGREAVDNALADLASGGDAPTSGANAADVVAVPDAQAAEVVRDPRLTSMLLRQPRPATYWLNCNVTRKPLDDARVRKALAYAVDRAAYVAEVLGGAARPAYSLLPYGVLGHDPAAGASYRLRPDAALALLEAARVEAADLEALAVTVPATADGRRAGAFLRDQLERHLGVRLAVTEIDRYGYLRALERRHYDLAFGGWQSAYPDPEAWFWLVFGADKAENRTGWQSAALDRLWRRADELVDPQRRLDLYAAAQQVLLDDMPVVFLAQPERLAVVHPRVAGLVPAITDDFPGAGALPRALLLADGHVPGGSDGA